MTTNSRRNALQLSVAALFSSTFMVNAANVLQVRVTVTDKQCESTAIAVNAGRTQFIIQNHSQKAPGWKVLKGMMVVGERENITPGLSQKMTTDLQPGEYDMVCGLLTSPKGRLIVRGEVTADVAQNDMLLSLGGAITAYKAYVMVETMQLVTDTKVSTDVTKTGDVEKAKTLYASACQHYEHIGPIAELFSSLDGNIDAREGNYEQKAVDPELTGFHRLEEALPGDSITKGMDRYIDQLYTGVVDLQKRINELAFPPSRAVGDVTGLTEEVATSKISGEEDRHNHTDLWDFQANVEGSQKIVDLLRP